jgi:chromosomal replication initiator protein
MQELWQQSLGRLANLFPRPDIFKTWIEVLTVAAGSSENGTELVLEAPSTRHIQYIQDQHYDEIIEKIVKSVNPAITKVTIVCRRSAPVEYNFFDEPKKDVSNEDIEKLSRQCGLHDGLRFDTFVTGKANQVARSSAEIVAQYPGMKHNPFFIYGGVGLGKTHLMHSVGRKILEDNPNCKLICISAERFIQEVVNLSAGGKLADENVKRFDDKYRNLDVLLIDDVQLLSAKGGTQQRLFGIFEALLPQNKQIILTCDSYATGLQHFDERLISRFTKGLSVSIEPAEFELRAAILLEKARQQGIDLPEDVAFMIATWLNTNIRELEGALQNVIMRARVFNKPITQDLAKAALQDIINTKSRISVENIQKTVADHFNIKIADMHSKRKTANVAFPRQIAMYLSKEFTQKSLIDIGNEFGGRDHATVLYAIKKINKERAQNQELNHTLHLIEQKLKSWN